MIWHNIVGRDSNFKHFMFSMPSNENINLPLPSMTFDYSYSVPCIKQVYMTSFRSNKECCRSVSIPTACPYLRSTLIALDFSAGTNVSYSCRLVLRYRKYLILHHRVKCQISNWFTVKRNIFFCKVQDLLLSYDRPYFLEQK